MEVHKVYKIVLTGGPCSGKTTALSNIKQVFGSEFIIFTLPEIATLTVNSGVNIIPTNFTDETHRIFTQSICQYQIDLEAYYETLAKFQKKDVILICDRGVVDNFAYCTEENQKKIFEETGWTQNFVCNNRYDLVIHLVTAAIGAQKYYTLENNQARYESIEEAQILDQKTLHQWNLHPNLKIIDNSQEGFKAKMRRVIDIISTLVQSPKSFFCKKYSLANPFDIKTIPKTIKLVKFQDFITFIVNNVENQVSMIIKRNFAENPFPSYFQIDRQFAENYQERIEKQKILSERKYYKLLNQKDKDKKTIKRNTYTFPLTQNDKVVQCSLEQILIEGVEKTWILRVRSDMKNLQQDIIPDFLKIEEDVTENMKYAIETFALEQLL